MKILIFVGYFYPHKGGLEDYVYRLSIGLIKKGYEISLLTNNSEKVSSIEIKDNIHIHRLDCYNTLNNKYPIPKLTINNIKILRTLLNKKYDFINTHTRFWVTTLIGLIFSKLKNIPLIHVEHGTCHTEIDKKFVSIVNKIVDHTLGELTVRNARTRVGVSDSAIDFMEHLGKKGDLKISKGLDLKKFKKKKNGLRKKLNIKSKNIIITSVGRFIYGKGFQDLLIAFSKLKKSIINNSKIIIIGDGDYKSELEELSSRLNIKNKVLFLGEKDQEEVINILSISDIFVNPSYSEGMPTTVLEAGAIGLPVIATDVGGTKEIIQNNQTGIQTGILIQPKNIEQLKSAIEFVINHKKEANKFAKNLHNLIRKDYNYDNMINKFVGVYENIKKQDEN